MNTVRFYKSQLFLYVFIICFALQNHYFNKYVFNWSFYENIALIVFFISVKTVLGSLIVLTVQSLKIVNKDKIITNEVLYLIANLILYYFVIASSLYLSTQVRF